MKRKVKFAALFLAVALLALALAGCAQDPPKHPLVAKWTLRSDDGKRQITYSFEAVGDAEFYLWTWDDEEGRLVQREYFWGEYTADDENGTVSLELENDDDEHRSAHFAYAIEADGQTLRLTDGDEVLILERAAENSARVR